MKPYYETKNGVLYYGDCLEVMPDFSDNSFDLCLTDPPYGIGEANGKNVSRCKLAIAKDYGKKEWDNKPPPPEAFTEIKRISKNQIIFGGNYFVENLGPSSCWIVWDKLNSGDFADCELAYTSFETAVRKIAWRWNGMIKQAPEKRYHPTQKPVGLFKSILQKYAEANQVIIDPYAGSGTTGIACESFGFRYVLIENDEEYCEIIANRIEAETSQLKLFA